MSPTLPECLFTDATCCAYVRVIREGHSKCFGSGIAELLGDRPDLCNATQFGAFQDEIMQADQALLPHTPEVERRALNDAWDVFLLRLKDVHGAWTALQFHETDLAVSGRTNCTVRFGVVFPQGAARDAVRANAGRSTGWRALSEQLPVLVAQFDHAHTLVHANKLAALLFASEPPGSSWRGCSSGSPLARLPDMIHDLVTEVTATQCVVSRCIEHVDAGAMVALHLIPVAVQAPRVESVLMIGHVFREPVADLVASARTSARVLRIWQTDATVGAAHDSVRDGSRPAAESELTQDASSDYELLHSQTRIRRAPPSELDDLKTQSDKYPAALPSASLGNESAPIGCVLFADDEQQVLSVGRRMLEHMGCRVLLASSGRIAVELFARHAADIDLVILDMTMPELTGPEALYEMHKVRPEVSCILTSGFSEHDILERVERTNIDGFLHKPFRMQDFLHLVKSVLDRRRVSGFDFPPADATSADNRAEGDR